MDVREAMESWGMVASPNREENVRNGYGEKRLKKEFF
jgi:hypothetical protein